MADPPLPVLASVPRPWIYSASAPFRNALRLPGFRLQDTPNSTSTVRYDFPSSIQGSNMYEGLEQAGSRTQDQFPERLTTTFSLPPLVRILSILIDAKNGLNGLTNALERPTALWDTQFTGQRPIVGVGHHFVVYASPYSESDRSGEQAESGAELYCIKAPVLTNGPTTHEFRSDFCHTVLQELRVLCHPILSQHENIVGLLGLDFQEDYDNFKVAWPVLLMEYAEHGTLDTFHQDLNLEPVLIRRLLLDIALGLKALHDSNIIHGDVKSENVLVCRHTHRKYVAKLSDFGFALINPTLNEKHQLPGCTRLWSAPESGNLLAVEGLQRTDVFSFGLIVWRVLLNCADPYLFLDRESTGVPPNLGHDEFVNEVKVNKSLPDLVILSLAQARNETYIKIVIRATLSPEPSERDLGRAISELSQDWEDSHSGNEGERSDLAQSYWEREDPLTSLANLNEAFPWYYMSFQFRRSVLFSLLENLHTIQQSNHVAAGLATNLYLQFSISPSFQLEEKGLDHCCQLLFRMCHLGSPKHRSIFHRFYQIHGRDLPDAFDSSWLDVAANGGSYFATESLSTSFKEQYEQWKKSLEIESSRLCATESASQRLLVTRCRLGDYAGCKELLNAGVLAVPIDETSPSALHWLVSFSNENEIWDLALGMIDHGADLDFKVDGGETDFLSGAIDGTPLHWAIWYRNLTLVQILLAIDPKPTKENLETAISLAALLHFHDVLEIFQTLIESGNLVTCAGIDMDEIMLFSTSNEMFLIRLLHHGKSALEIAGNKTLDVLFQMHNPSQTVIEQMLELTAIQNSPGLFRYLLSQLGAAGVEKIPKAKAQAWLLSSVGAGFLDVFDAVFESGFLQFDEGFLQGGVTGLQLCCLARQRDPIFLQRFLDWGCEVDIVGGTEAVRFAPFAIAVWNGLYECANLLLRYGADKDFLSGWLGGTTAAFAILLTWPDVPISRMRYLLQDLPRLGFGHINFIGWPGAAGNLLYGLAMSHWAHYTASYRFPETFKYILSMMAHRDCLDQTDRMGCTVINMASRDGKLEICRLLLEAGVNPNTGLGISPLNAAMDWLQKCRQKEADTLNSQVLGERRHAIKLRKRAEECVGLLQSYGAVRRGFLENLDMTRAHLLNGGMRLPSATLLLECLSGLIDRSTTVDPGSTPLHPTRRTDFRAYGGQRNPIQKRFVRFGEFLDSFTEGESGRLSGGIPRPIGSKGHSMALLWQPHNCYPWHPCRHGGPPLQHPPHATRPRGFANEIPFVGQGAFAPQAHHNHPSSGPIRAGFWPNRD